MLWLFHQIAQPIKDEHFLILSISCNHGRHRSMMLGIWFTHLFKMVCLPVSLEYNRGWRTDQERDRLCSCPYCNYNLLWSVSESLWAWRIWSAPRVLGVCNEYWRLSRSQESLWRLNQLVCDFARRLEESPLVDPDYPEQTLP